MKGVTIAAAWLVLAALSSASAESGPARVVAGTDLGRHTVPLEQVLFDTFDGGMLPLSQATEAQVLRLRDAIRPVWNPRYDSVQEAGRWLAPEDLLVAYVAGGAALAYPVRILNFHEIVNETVDGVPILISYCPLCGSGIVYDRRLDGRELVFGNTSALYESDMVMYDRDPQLLVPGERRGDRRRAGRPAAHAAAQPADPPTAGAATFRTRALARGTARSGAGSFRGLHGRGPVRVP